MEPDVTDHEFPHPPDVVTLVHLRDSVFWGIQVVEVQTGKDDVQEWWK